MFIELTNIQSIEHAVFNLPEKGIVDFRGKNSNGKSILMKALKLVCSDSIKSEADRKPLIRRGCECGMIVIGNNNRVLACNIAKDRNDCRFCYIRYTDDGKEFRQDYGIRENLLKDHIKSLGFRYYPDEEIVLQFCETFGKIPFINTSQKTNGAIIESVCKDEIASQFIENYSHHTFEEIKKAHKEFSSSATTYMSALNNLEKVENLPILRDLSSRIEAALKYQRLRKLNFSYVKPVPNVKIINKLEPIKYYKLPINLIRKLSFRKIKLPPLILPKAPIISRGDKELNDYLTALNMVCPTCGKPLD